MTTRRVLTTVLTAMLAAAVGTAEPPCIEFVPLGTFDLPSTQRSFAFDGSRLYNPAGVMGLVIMNVEDPSVPEVDAVLALPGSAQRIAVSDGLAVVGCFEGAAAFTGLVMVDVSDPLAPLIVGQLDLPSQPRAVTLAGQIAYAAGGSGGLYVVDIADPSAPSLLATYADEIDFAAHASVSGDRLAMIAFNWDDFEDGGLVMLDVADPAAPVLLGWAGLDDALQVTLEGDTAFVADGVFLMRIFDVSDPAQPVQVSSGYGGLWGNDCLSVQVEGTMVYAFDDRRGIVAIDVSNPVAPVALASADAAAATMYAGGMVHDGTAYIRAQSGGLVHTMSVGPCYDCPVDINGDRVLDFFDVSQFVSWWIAGDARADFNEDGVLDIFDLLAYLNAFSSGCS